MEEAPAEDFSYAGTAREIMFFGEGRDGEGVLLLNERYTDWMDPGHRRELIRAFSILAREQLYQEMTQCGPEALIEISPDPSMQEMAFALRFLLDEHHEMQLLTYFGGLADQRILLIQGISHILEALILLEQSL